MHKNDQKMQKLELVQMDLNPYRYHNQWMRRDIRTHIKVVSRSGTQTSLSSLISPPRTLHGRYQWTTPNSNSKFWSHGLKNRHKSKQIVEKPSPNTYLSHSNLWSLNPIPLTNAITNYLAENHLFKGWPQVIISPIFCFKKSLLKIPGKMSHEGWLLFGRFQNKVDNLEPHNQ